MAFTQSLMGAELDFPLLTADEQHLLAQGTSMATPVVSGGVALYLQRNPQASTDIIRHTLLPLSLIHI